MFRPFFSLIASAMIAITAPAIAADVEPSGGDLAIALEGQQVRKSCADEGRELQLRILAGTADAKLESDTAVARDCFRLITTYSSIPTGIAYAPGIECSPNSALFRSDRLSLFSFSGSDVVTLDHEQARRNRAALESIWAFALDYNAMIVAHAAFPYPDLCRLAARDYRPTYHYSLEGDRNRWGLRPLEETDEPRDLHEAARRGTLASLQRLLTERPHDLHALDIVELPPLTWAVIYGRPEHVRLLLKAGANPYGQQYISRSINSSPITLAREAGRDDLEALMMAVLQ
jgi:hypothetical protein